MSKYTTLVFLTLAAVAAGMHAQNTYPWPQNGNIGIGTTNPGAALDVVGGSVRATGDIIPGGNGVVRALLPIAMPGGEVLINSSTTWQRVTRTNYTWDNFVSVFTGVAVLPGATRQYYLVIRKADTVTTQPGSYWRFACEGGWNGGNDAAAHGFSVPNDWGSADEGSTQWVQVPPNAITGSGCSTPYWKLDAKTAGPGGMRVMSVSIAAVDVYGGSSPAYSASNPGNDTFPALSALYDTIWATGPYGSGKVGIGTTSPGLNGELLSVFSPNVYSIRAQGASGNAILLGSQAGSAAGWVQAPNSSGGLASLSLNPVGGNVGIGTTSPSQLLEVNGTAQIDGALNVGNSGITFPGSNTPQTTPWTGVLCGGDYAEAVNASGGKRSYEPGDVLVLASDTNGNVEKSHDAYSTMVAGIYATKPGVIGRRQSLVKDADELPMAMVGIVPTKVTAENGSIKQGDLLVTSSRTGYAMKGTDRSRMLGAVIGKAMGSLDSGAGTIEVLVTLQ